MAKLPTWKAQFNLWNSNILASTLGLKVCNLIWTWTWSPQLDQQEPWCHSLGDMNSNIMKRVIERDFFVRDYSGNLTWITPVFESSPVLKIVQFDKLWSSNFVSANDLSLTLTCEWQSCALFLSTSQNCRPKQMKVAHSKEALPSTKMECVSPLKIEHIWGLVHCVIETRASVF